MTKTFQMIERINGANVTTEVMVNFETRRVETHVFGLDSAGRIFNHRTGGELARGWTVEDCRERWAAIGLEEVR